VHVSFTLTDEERETLERWARRPKSSQALALRCRIVLAAADGEHSKDIAARLGCSASTVGKWRGRFARQRLDGLHDEPRPGRPRTVGDDDVERVIVKTLEEPPPNATHWSTRSMAAATGMSQTAVSRIWRALSSPTRPRASSSPRTRCSSTRSATSRRPHERCAHEARSAPMGSKTTARQLRGHWIGQRADPPLSAQTAAPGMRRPAHSPGQVHALGADLTAVICSRRLAGP
jgi:transposase